MNEGIDVQEIPGPSEDRSIWEDALFETSSLPSTPSLSSGSEDSCDSDDLEPHVRGRRNPPSQTTQLGHQDYTVVFSDLTMPGVEIPEAVENLCAKAQRLADGVGMLGEDAETLAAHLASAAPLSKSELDRFEYPFVIAKSPGPRLGDLVSLRLIQELVGTAARYESYGAHEEQWNEHVHSALIKMALAASVHSNSLDVKSLQAANIDPKGLASSTLPRRVVDYCYTLKPDDKITDAWSRLRPLPNACARSWNNTTRSDVRTSPIAVNIVTRTPNRSWTEGKAQLGVWINSFLSRLRLLPEYDRVKPRPSLSLAIPAMPLVIVQGHDWHLLFVSQTSAPLALRTTVWQKIDMGSSRTCFDAYKVVAILHLLADWAETTWRPWFHAQLEKPDAPD